MNADELRARTRLFALEVIRLCGRLGFDDLARTIRPQLLRSATGIASNYRATCRSRSRKEFASRLGVVVEECDESELWLDFIETLGLGNASKVALLRREALELVKIMSSSRTTALKRLRQQRLRRNKQRG